MNRLRIEKNVNVNMIGKYFTFTSSGKSDNDAWIPRFSLSCPEISNLDIRRHARNLDSDLPFSEETRKTFSCTRPRKKSGGNIVLILEIFEIFIKNNPLS